MAWSRDGKTDPRHLRAYMGADADRAAMARVNQVFGDASGPRGEQEAWSSLMGHCAVGVSRRPLRE
ncbi:MAG: hypothetical protein WA880_04760, partial [Ornithinimicrobium sp.]